MGDITVDAFIACDESIAFAGGNSIRDHSWKMTRPTGETFMAGFEEICLMLAHAEVCSLFLFFSFSFFNSTFFTAAESTQRGRRGQRGQRTQQVQARMTRFDFLIGIKKIVN